MKCVESGCNSDAASGSNYCSAHAPSGDRYEHKKAEREFEKRVDRDETKRPDRP